MNRNDRMNRLPGFVVTAALLLPLSLMQTPAQAQALPLAPAPVVSLPDFTPLVERAGPAVVNIEANSGMRSKDDDKLAQSDDSGQSDDEQVPEIFRRFFGPGFPGPGFQGPRGGQRPSRSMGTGFIISSDGYVLTNHHVIDGADEVIVRLNDRRELTAKVVGSDPLADVAVLKLDASNLPTVKIGDSGTLKPGQWVMAIGSPFGFEHSVTAGVVSGVGRRSLDTNQQYVPFIQTDVAINPGNSGGPLLNTRAEVVGINSQIFSNSGGYMGVSLAIPIEVAMNSVRQIKATGKVVRGQLGVQIQDVNRDLAKSMGLSRPGGALVARVEPGSAAEKAGIQTGDVISAFNGKEVVHSSDLPPMVGAMPPNSRATVTVLRDRKPVELEVKLGALTESVANASVPSKDAKATGNALGLVVQELTAAERSELGLKPGEGVRIARVEGLTARRAGISAGDVVLMVGSARVGSVAQFNAAVKAVKSGDSVRLLVRNEQSTGFIAITAP